MPSSLKSSVPSLIVSGNQSDTIYQIIVLTQWGVSGTTLWGLIKRISNIWINEEQHYRNKDAQFWFPIKNITNLLYYLKTTPNNWNKDMRVLLFYLKKLNGSWTGNELPPMIRVAFLLTWQCPPHHASTLWWAIILSVKTLIGGRPSLENPNNIKIKAPLLNSGRWVC